LGCASVPVRVAHAQCVIADPCSFTFNATNGQSPAPQPLTITVDGGMYFNAVASVNSTVNGIQWLSVVPPTGTLGGSLGGAPTVRPNVVVNSASMPAGNYSGNIFLTVQISGGGTQSANLPVTLTITGGSFGGPSLTFDRASVTLAATAGGAPVSQNAVLSTSTPASFSASASSAGGWLSVSPNSGMTSPTATLAITANPAYLSAGTYTGMVTATSGPSSQTLSVSLVVTARPPLVLAADHSSVTFAFEQGSALPPAQVIQLTSTGGTATFS